MVILTKEFCDSQPHATLTVVNQDGSIVTDRIMMGPYGYFAGMIRDAQSNPVDKIKLDAHIGNTRFCGKPHATLLSEQRVKAGRCGACGRHKLGTRCPPKK